MARRPADEATTATAPTRMAAVDAFDSGGLLRDVRLRFRAPEHVQVAGATIERICEGLDVEPGSRATLRRETEQALAEWLADASAVPSAEAPVELVILARGGTLRLELRRTGREPVCIEVPLSGSR